MKRRTFLTSAVAAGAALIPVKSFASGFIGAVAPQTYPVIADIDASTSAPHLIAVLDAFWARNIPVTCLVSPFDDQGQPLGPQSPLARLLSGFLLGGSGIEIAPFQPELATLSQHFQARAAHDAVAALQGMLQPVERTLGLPIRVQTLACHDVASPMSPIAVRTAGVFNILCIPEESAPVRSETWENGVARLFGGSRVDLAADAPPAEDGTTPTQTVAYLSARAFAELPLDDLEAAAAAYAERLTQQELDGTASLLPVSDLQLRDAYQFNRFVCLHVTDPLRSAGADQAGHDALLDLLAEMELPFSRGPDIDPGTPDADLGMWVPTEPPTPAESEAPSPPAPHPIRLIASQSDGTTSIRTTRPLAAGIAVRIAPSTQTRRGLDAEGVLTLPQRTIQTPVTADTLAAAFAGVDDMVVLLRPEDFATQDATDALKRHLETLRADAITTCISINDLARRVVPKGPVPMRHRRVAAARPELVPPSGRLSERARDTLLDDAKAAWRYLDPFCPPESGLCPSTVDFSPGGRLHEAVTMWDVGSQINGLVAASQIGLISSKDFAAAIAKILPNIAGRVSQDRRLPQGWIRTDRTRWGNKNFDGSDAGRLLASLDNLRRHSTFGDQLEELVASYDLDQVIRDGEIFSVTDGALHSSYISHSAHYSALAFRRWGHQVRSPYEVFSGRSVNDGQIALLEAVVGIGPIGAEPLLLEGLELGMSDESAYLADVLFTTQLEEYRETGRMICVSEGPIDSAPWFLYQGLQLDAQSRTWAMDTVGREPEYRTPEFRDEFLAVSSKAAYLWSAMQPHDYSDRLTHYVRDTAKTQNGFASSIFVKTGRATKNYTDLNTNSIILQAIAHKLNTTG